MPFENGQRVVCIKAHTGMNYEETNVPKVGELYFVRSTDRYDGILLREIRNAEQECVVLSTLEFVYGEPSFEADHFRPLCRTDISVFTEKLSALPARDRAGNDLGVVEAEITRTA